MTCPGTWAPGWLSSPRPRACPLWMSPISPSSVPVPKGPQWSVSAFLGHSTYRGGVANALNSKTDPREPEKDEAERAPLLWEPREGLPEITSDADALTDVIAALRSGAGPVAIDAERASGYRYGQRAYLVQVRREGAGTALIDPVPCSDLSELSSALISGEFAVTACQQVLSCLTEFHLPPSRLFVPELAGRLLGCQRVGLGAIVERLVGLRLAKDHCAVNWSQRA